MTTSVSFNPASYQATQFSATFDGNPYTCIVSWNVFGQRWYISAYDVNSNLIFTLPLIASPQNYNINLLAGYFNTSVMTYQITNQQIVVTP